MTIPALPNLCWPIDPGCLTTDFELLDAEVQDRAKALAVMTLRRLTADRVGGCAVTVRPCPQQHQGYPLRGFQFGVGAMPWTPVLYDGVWINCACERPCDCSSGCELVMPGVVGRVDAIEVSGVQLTLSDFTLVDGHIITYRGTGDCPFPKRPDMTAALGSPDTLAVTYLPGYPVDGAAAWAAGVLAVEFAKACAGDTKCRLPKNVTAIVRQGVSLTLTPGTFPNGVTGIREVDAWVELWNPNHLKRKPSVWSPDQAEWRQEVPLP